MAKHNAANTRIKREYFQYLKEAMRRDEASIDAVAKALSRFEEANGHKDFGRFHREQAVAVNALYRLYLAAHLTTLIVWGARDEIIPVAHAYAAHDAIPNSRMEILDAIGHFPHAEAPERFLEVLRDFLGSTDAEPARPARLHELIRAR